MPSEPAATPALKPTRWQGLAKASAVSPLMVVLVFTVARLGAPILKDMLALFFVGLGLIAGVVALASISRHGRGGVLAPALVGLTVNGLFGLIFASNFLSHTAAASQWRAQDFDDLGITVDFPGTPKESVKDQPTALGPMTLRTRRLDLGDATTFQLIDVRINESHFDGFVKATCGALKVPEVLPVPATQGLPAGAGCSGTTDKGLIRFRAFLLGGRLIEAIAGAEDVTSPDPQRFVDSIRALQP